MGFLSVPGDAGAITLCKLLHCLQREAGCRYPRSYTTGILSYETISFHVYLLTIEYGSCRKTYVVDILNYRLKPR